MKISQRAQRIKVSPTMAITATAAALRAAGKDVIGLGAGEPDFPSPEAAKEAAIAAIRADKSHYTAVDGIVSLKEAIQEKLHKQNSLDYKLNEIIVSVGAKQSLFNLVMAILESGDEAIIPAPYWVSYLDMVELAGAKPVCITSGKEENFKISPQQLQESLNDKTRLFFLNSPSNPTGKIYSAAELNDLAQVLLEYPQVAIVSDEIYEHILWEGKFCNILNVCPQLKDRVIIINGVSKCYAMTGWRIGYAAGNVEIIKAMKKIQSQSTSNPTSISQYAAEAALQGDDSQIEVMNKEFKKRHDLMAQMLTEINGVEVVPADGTFYLFPRVTGLIERTEGITDDVQLCAHILDEAEVAIVPGSAFGAPGYMRLSYATSLERVEEAMQRLQRIFK